MKMGKQEEAVEEAVSPVFPRSLYCFQFPSFQPPLPLLLLPLVFPFSFIFTCLISLLWLVSFSCSSSCKRRILICQNPWRPREEHISFHCIAASILLRILNYCFITRVWRRQWQSTPVLLPGKSHGQRSLVGCSPWGRTESDTTDMTAAAAGGIKYCHSC